MEDISDIIVGEFPIVTTFDTFRRNQEKSCHVSYNEEIRKTHPPNSRFEGSGFTSANNCTNDIPKSCSVIWSKGFPPKIWLNTSSVHFSSAAEVVVCHCQLVSMR